MENSANGFLLDKALAFAARAHQGQFRKGTEIPYISHPYAVGLILQGAGCRREVVAAGILHDLLEDTPVTMEQLRKEFGPEIAALVEGCSEPGHDELPWETRKEHTIAYLKSAPVEIRMVACADKLHNVRSMMVDYRQVGEESSGNGLSVAGSNRNGITGAWRRVWGVSWIRRNWNGFSVNMRQRWRSYLINNDALWVPCVKQREVS